MQKPTAARIQEVVSDALSSFFPKVQSNSPGDEKQDQKAVPEDAEIKEKMCYQKSKYASYQHVKYRVQYHKLTKLFL